MYLELIRFIFRDSSIAMKEKRGTSSTKKTGFEQVIPQGNNQQELLNDSEYKYQMIEMIQQYVLEFGSEILPRYTPFITSRDNKYFISSVGNQVISSCNHEYAGTRLVLQGSKVDSDVVVVCKDTVVYILMI